MFLTPELADSLSMESELQQISSDLRDSSQYSGRFQQWCCLDGLDSSSELQRVQSLSKPLETVPSLQDPSQYSCRSVVWMVSTRPLISKSSSSFTNPSVTVTSAPITIRINVTFMFHGFFSSLARSWYLSFCFSSVLNSIQPEPQSPLFGWFFFFFTSFICLFMYFNYH